MSIGPTVLLVPMHLDALFLSEATQVAPPMADFSGLPFVENGEDRNASTPWLGESIAAQPFSSAPVTLEPGFHLHWALPDALCRARKVDADTPGAVSYPRVPDRWLVRKVWTGAGGEQVKQWVVESNYLHPFWHQASGVATSYPFPSDLEIESVVGQPFRYMGRAIPLEQFLEQNQAANTYLGDPLTAVGYGNPSFASFYPNCASVFGFCDRSASLPMPAGLRYEVLGWYENSEHDFLRRAVMRGRRDRPTPPSKRLQVEIAAVLKELHWHSDRPISNDRVRMVCQGRVDVAQGGATAASAGGDELELTFGNSTAEALSAYLAQRYARASGSERADPVQIEEQLEAALLSARLDQRQTDVGMMFERLRHAKSFVSAPPDFLWTIRMVDEQGAHAAAIDWPDTAQLLTDLNQLQKQYNASWDQIRQARRQLVSDWHKFMQRAYTASIPGDGLPNADALRLFIEQRSLPNLQTIMTAAGELVAPVSNEAEAHGVTVEPASGAGSLAWKIRDAHAALRVSLQAHAAPAPSRLKLMRYVAPRYFQPTEPAILLTNGRDIVSGDRYNRGVRDDKAATLVCLYMELGANDLARDLSRIATFLDSHGWERRNWSQPWHPLLMEWEAEIKPLVRLGSGASAAFDYAPDFIRRNFKLQRHDVDLAPVADRTALAANGHVYNGSALLTPHGASTYFAILKSTLDRLDNAHAAAPQDEPANDEPADVIMDGSANPNGQVASYARRVASIHGRFNAMPMMAQSLSGLNDAMLMNRAGLQLPVYAPLGFSAEQRLARDIRRLVGDKVHRSVEPAFGFMPIRAGQLRLRRVRIIDTFGQIRQLDWSKVSCFSASTLQNRSRSMDSATTLALPKDLDGPCIVLPPRLTQPARLHFRWHAAASPGQEAHVHPEATPIAGWLMANHIDRSLFAFAPDGEALGYLELAQEQVRWRATPGSVAPDMVLERDIASAPLRQFLRFFLRQPGSYFSKLLQDLEQAQALIEPEDAGDSMLMGRPLALARACLALELQGPPAHHQGMAQMGLELADGIRTTTAFTGVQFPIRLGNQDQSDDGLAIYFPEDALGQYDGYVIPDYLDIDAPDVPAQDRKCDFLYQAVDSVPLMVTMLLDPRGKVHATTGVLPVKSIDIPRHYYDAALSRIDMCFLAAPLLADRDAGSNKIAIPLADVPGRSWVYVERQGAGFGQPKTLLAAPLEIPFAAPLAVREGWLRLKSKPPAVHASGDNQDE